MPDFVYPDTQSFFLLSNWSNTVNTAQSIMKGYGSECVAIKYHQKLVKSTTQHRVCWQRVIKFRWKIERGFLRLEICFVLFGSPLPFLLSTISIVIS